jgi:hypothetical protein
MAPIRQLADMTSKFKQGDTGKTGGVLARQKMKKEAGEYDRPIRQQKALE